MFGGKNNGGIVLAEAKSTYRDPWECLNGQWPFTYDAIRVEEGRRPVGFRFSKHIINIIAQLGHRELIVTGEADTYDLARAKARSELLERSTLISYGTNCGAETSNGWAAHPNMEQARENAIFELLERDAVLAQWYSSTPFIELQPSDWPSEIQKWAAGELGRSEFPRMRILLSTQGLGPSVTCLFVNKQGFGVSAHGSRTTLAESIHSAITEACRPAHSSIRREHWKNTLKLKLGHGDPSAPDAHAVYYAYHEPFPEWMFGATVTWDQALNLWNRKISDLKAQADQFEVTEVMTAPLYVVFAKHPQAFPLRWGTTDPDWVAGLSASRRLSFNTINKSVHIVS